MLLYLLNNMNETKRHYVFLSFPNLYLGVHFIFVWKSKIYLHMIRV